MDSIPNQHPHASHIFTRRTFLALSASTLSLGAVGYFEAPASTTAQLPPQWDLLERALNENRLGPIDFAHIAYAPERPTDLWAILAMLHAHSHWQLPQRVSVIADAAPILDGPPIHFLGTIEINPRIRVTVDARHHETRTSAFNGQIGRLLVFPARAEFIGSDKSETQPVAWRTAHEYAPPSPSAAWASAVCDALRQAARTRGAVTFTETGEISPAPHRA